MAKFKDSTILADATVAEEPRDSNGVADRSIGSIIAETRNLSAEDVERILAYQRERGIRFGEAAVALGFASSDDVMFALAQQFHYPYAPTGVENVSPELVVLTKPFGVQAESFRSLRSQILMRVGNDRERRALAVVSPESKDGKTFFACNLAAALAQLGGRTLIVDADLRHPRVHTVFGIESKSGLSSVLSGRAEDRVIQVVPGVPSLFVLPVGVVPPNPSELVERPAFGLLMRELVVKFDHVVVDTPAACYGGDGAIIAARSGAAVVIARKDASRVEALQDLVGSIHESPARLAGVVFNEF